MGSPPPRPPAPNWSPAPKEVPGAWRTLEGFLSRRRSAYRDLGYKEGQTGKRVRGGAQAPPGRLRAVSTSMQRRLGDSGTEVGVGHPLDSVAERPKGSSNPDIFYVTDSGLVLPLTGGWGDGGQGKSWRSGEGAWGCLWVSRPYSRYPPPHPPGITAQAALNEAAQSHEKVGIGR